MKIRQIKDSKNQHIVAIERGDELRCFFKNSSLHTAQVAFDNLCRDIARHGESVAEFDTLPIISVRIAKSGRRIYDTEPVGSVGRPAAMDGGKKVNTYLDAESVEIAKRIGNGNVSEGIRKALKQAGGHEK